MDETMLGRVVKKLVNIPDLASGIVYDLLEKLSGKEWKEWLELFKLLSRFSPEEAIKALSKINPLFIDLFTVSVQKANRFVAKDKFVAKNNCVSLRPKFVELISEWVEEEFEATELKVSQLKEGSMEILEAFGSKEAVEITLGQLFQALEDKRFRDGKFYFALIKGTNLAVYFYWKKGWYFEAYSTRIPYPWQTEDCIITRNPGS
jgi:hypothetical protein